MSMKLLLCIVIDIIALTLQTLTIVFSLKNVNSLWFMNQINWMAIIYYILFLINFICNLCNKYSKSEKCYAECFMCIIRMLLFAFGPIYIPSSFFLMGKNQTIFAITNGFVYCFTMASIILSTYFFRPSYLANNSNDYSSNYDCDNHSDNNEYQSQAVTNDFNNFATSNNNDLNNFVTSNNDFDNNNSNNYDNNEQNNFNYLDYV